MLGPGGGAAELADVPRARDGSEAMDHRLPALDGLRAMTMAVVLAYHGQLPGVNGAFLGISQFFTLSGFLITSILLRAHERTGHIDLRAFWTRRYRRLLPAAWLALGGAVLFGATVATEQQLAELPGGVVASLAQVANWFFIVQDQSYVDLFVAPSPVQQFWSLAVEEQLYLIVPVAVYVLLRRTRSPKVLAGVLGGGAVASTVLMVVLYERGASLDRLYYGTDTRAAELLVGAVLAVVLHARPTAFSDRARQALGIGGVVAFAAIVWAWTAIDLTDPALWRGGFLVFSIVSAVLVTSILAGRGPMAMVFGWGPLPAIGRITYGLYLFHWPIFLWLTEERTGLDVWPLFALRIAVTAAVATASYHLLEMPIRNRSALPTRHHLRWVAIPSAAALLVGAVVIGQRDVQTDLAGLGEEIKEAPTVATADPVLDVLAIADARGAPLVDELVATATSSGSMAVHRAAPFECSDVDPAAPAPTCVNWDEEWSDAIARVDPDVVLLAVSDWPTPQLAALSGSRDPAVQTDFAEQALDHGVDVLTARGATVVWDQPPFESIGAATRIVDGPFHEALNRLSRRRLDLRKAGVAGDELVELLQRNRRRDPADEIKVLVVGDSSSLTLGYGLERWGDETGEVVVWSTGVEGCGGILDGAKTDEFGREIPPIPRCREVEDEWRSQVEVFDPDVVVVLATRFDLSPRRLEGWDGFKEPGDAEFDAFMVESYVRAVDILSSGGARVVWMLSPCPADGAAVLTQVRPLRDEAVRHVNDVVLPRVVGQRPELRLFDLYDVLCPDGRYTEGIGDIETVRPDGLHFSPEASLWLAREYGDQMLAG